VPAQEDKEESNMSTSERIGRFSDGMERLEGHPEQRRPGRFSDGMEVQREDPENGRLGRFSTGQELRDEGPDHLRVGRFGDGMERPRRVPPAPIFPYRVEREPVTRKTA